MTTRSTPPPQSPRYYPPSTNNSSILAAPPPPPEYLSRSQWIRSSLSDPLTAPSLPDLEIQIHNSSSGSLPPSTLPPPPAMINLPKPSPSLSHPPLLDDHHHSPSDSDAQNFDDYDWDNDDDLDRDVRFDDLNSLKQGLHHHHRRRTLARRLSPYAIVKYIVTTFIGNIFLAAFLIVPPLVLRFKGYYQTGSTPSDVHTRHVHDNVAAWLYWASYNLLASWALHFLVELAPRLFILLVAVIWGDVSESIKSHIETFHTAKAWLKATFYAAMLWGSWVIIFDTIFHLHHSFIEGPSPAPYTDTVSLVVELFFFFTLILSLEKLVLLSISMSFHCVAYSDRIQKVTRALTVIDILQDYRPKRKTFQQPATPGMGHRRPSSGDVLHLKNFPSQSFTPPSKSSNPKSSGLSSPFPPSNDPRPKNHWWKKKYAPRQPSSEADMEMSAKLDIDSPPGTRPHPLGDPLTCQSDNPYRPSHSQTPTTPDLTNPLNNSRPALKQKNSQTTLALFARRGASAAKIARAAIKDPVAVVGKKSGLALDINNPTQARNLARRIFFAFRGDANRNYLIPSDFFPAFPTEKLAKEAFSIFDSDGNGDISRSEVKNEIFRVYKERRALSQSLKDVGHAIKRLDSILLGLAAVVFVFIALGVLGIDFSKTLTSVSTVLIALAFVFKETAANVFDAIILLFCSHPLDTGDRIIIQNDNGVEEILTVKQMGLLSTIFVRWDGTEWFAPNAVLGKKFIINLRRSFNQFENATVQFGWNTPLEKIDELEDKLNFWLQTDEERRFEPGTAAVIQNLVNQEYIEITFGMVHRENWQDWGGRWNRRNAFHAAINYYCKELGITFYSSEQPIEMRNWNQAKRHLFMGHDHPNSHDDYGDDNDYNDDDEFLAWSKGGKDEIEEPVLSTKGGLTSQIKVDPLTTTTTTTTGHPHHDVLRQQTISTPASQASGVSSSRPSSSSSSSSSSSHVIQEPPSSSPRQIDQVEVDKLSDHDQHHHHHHALGHQHEHLHHEVFGFLPPNENGNGMRKRKKLSKKKAMCGDA